MSAHTNIQIIEHTGEPAFAIIPYKDYLNLIPHDNDEYIPNEMEKSDNELKTVTLEKLAKAMDLSVEQIQD